MSEWKGEACGVSEGGGVVKGKGDEMKGRGDEGEGSWGGGEGRCTPAAVCKMTNVGMIKDGCHTGDENVT